MMIPPGDLPRMPRGTRLRSLFSYASLAVPCLLAACGESTAREAVTVTDSAGVTIVDNDDARPAWTLETAWHLAQTPAIQIGNRPGEEGQQIYRARHSLKLANGNFAVANVGLGDVRLYDSTGFYLRSLAMPENEESEPIRPLRLHELPGDSLLVVLADHSVAVFDSLGSMARRSAPLSTDLPSDPGPAFAGVFGNGVLMLKVYPPEDTAAGGVERTHVRLLTYDVDGTPLGSLGEFEDLEVLRGEGVYVFGAEGLEATADSTLWYGPGDRYELREVASDGSTRRIVRLNRPPAEVLTVDKASYRHSAIGELDDSMSESAANEAVEKYRYAETFPSYSEIVVDDAGNVWVKAYQWFGLGQPQKWNVFDRDGRFLGEFIMPTLMEVHHIGEDYVLGRMVGQRGREAVYYYPLIKPAAPAEGNR